MIDYQFEFKTKQSKPQNPKTPKPQEALKELFHIFDDINAQSYPKG